MEALREYLLSVTAAAVLCALAQRMQIGKGGGQKIGRILTGVFMTLTVLGPFAEISLSEFDDLSLSVSQQVQAAVRDGEETAQTALAECISDSITAYIMDKASKMDVNVRVQVELTDGPIPMPCKVYLQGSVSPYKKTKLQNMIRDDLGINKEDQIWT